MKEYSTPNVTIYVLETNDVVTMSMDNNYTDRDDWFGE